LLCCLASSESTVQIEERNFEVAKLFVRRLQQVPIIRPHIPQLRLLILRQPNIHRRLLPLPVLRPASVTINATRQDTNSRESETNRVPSDELRRISRHKCKGSNNPAEVAKADLPRTAYTSSVVPSEVHVVPAHYDRHRRVCPHGHQEESAVLQFHVIVDGDEYTQPGNRHANAENSEPKPVHEIIRQRGNKHAIPERSCPWRDGVQLRLDGRVAVTFDDSWREVGVAVRGHDEAEVHEAGDDDFIVGEDFADVAECDGPVAGGSALVFAEAGGDVGFFFGGEPFGFLREVGHDEEEDDGDEDCEEAF